MFSSKTLIIGDTFGNSSNATLLYPIHLMIMHPIVTISKAAATLAYLMSLKHQTPVGNHPRHYTRIEESCQERLPSGNGQVFQASS
jgi:hypothetical protein